MSGVLGSVDLLCSRAVRSALTGEIQLQPYRKREGTPCPILTPPVGTAASFREAKMKTKILISRTAAEQVARSLESLMEHNIPRSPGFAGMRGPERVTQWLALNKEHGRYSPKSSGEAKSCLAMMKEGRVFEIYLEVCEALEAGFDASHDARIAKVAARCVTPAWAVVNGLIEYGLRHAEQQGYSGVLRAIDPPRPSKKRAA